VPEVISRKFRLWVALVEESGIRGSAMYVEHETGEIELIEVLEVNKHEY
jgi:hypothetical protein